MKITDEAKEDLLSLMHEHKADGVRVVIQETCCGKNPEVGLDVFGPEEAVQEINGIPVIFPKEDLELTEPLVIDKVDGELVVFNPDQNCGCAGCSGCTEE